MDPDCKTIHQTWKTSDVPEHWKESEQKWKSLHPDWQYKLWTDEDNLVLIESNFPQYLDMFKKFEYNIQRADFVRYAILYIYGGLYSDLDIVPLRAFDDLFGGGKSDVYLMKNNNYLSSSLSICIVTNALMIAGKKNSPFWLEVMKEVESRYKYPKWTWKFKHRKVINITGPGMLQHVVHNYQYPIALLPTDVTLCSICDRPGTVRGDNPRVMLIEGQSWNGWDTKTMNFVFCNARVIAALTILLVIRFIYRFYAYRKCCKSNECSA